MFYTVVISKTPSDRPSTIQLEIDSKDGVITNFGQELVGFMSTLGDCAHGTFTYTVECVREYVPGTFIFDDDL